MKTAAFQSVIWTETLALMGIQRHLVALTTPTLSEQIFPKLMKKKNVLCHNLFHTDWGHSDDTRGKNEPLEDLWALFIEESSVECGASIADLVNRLFVSSLEHSLNSENWEI